MQIPFVDLSREATMLSDEIKNEVDLKKSFYVGDAAGRIKDKKLAVMLIAESIVFLLIKS